MPQGKINTRTARLNLTSLKLMWSANVTNHSSNELHRLKAEKIRGHKLKNTQ